MSVETIKELKTIFKMVTISSSSIRQNVFETIYDLLKAKATSEDYGTSVQPTVTASYIDDVHTFPQIVVKEPDVERENYVFDRSSSDKPILLAVEIYCLKTKDRSILADNIDTFMHATKITGLMINDYSETNDVQIDNASKIRSKTISINFLRR